MRNKITRQDIYQLSSTRDVFVRGYNLYTNGGVSELNVDSDGVSETLSTYVTENGKRTYSVKVFFDLKTNRIAGHMCNCGHRTMWRGACDHIIAALLYAAEGEYTQPLPAPEMSSKLMRVFENAYLAELDPELEADKPVHLYPMLHISEDEAPRLSLSIGRDRRYVVRDIEALVESVKSSSYVKYGQGLAFRHTLRAFDKDAGKLIKLIKRTLRCVYECMDAAVGYYNADVGRYLPLMREFTDDFFALYKSLDVELDGHTLKSVPVTDVPPEIGVSVSYTGDVPMISGTKTDFAALTGRKYGYFIDDKIHIVDKSYVKIMSPLLSAINASDSQKLSVRPENAHNFSTAVLPTLQRLNAVAQADEPPAAITDMALTTEIYLDHAAKAVTCTVIFRYGDIEINPLDGSKPKIPRDSVQERRVTRFLEDSGFIENNRYYTLSGDDEIYAFYCSGLSSLYNFTEVFTTDEFAKKSYIPSVKSRVGVRLSGDLIELDFETGYTPAELLEALESYRAKKKYHRLTDGRFINLTAAADAAEVLSAFELSRKDIRDGTIRLPMYRGLYLNSILERQNREVTDPRLSEMAADFDDIGGYELPSGFNGVLRQYQKTGYEWLRTLAEYNFGGILADEMGLGKTIQVIALVLAEVQASQKPSIVVAPTSLIYNWEHEFKRFAPEVVTAVIAGLPDKRRELLQAPAHVFITTYDTLKRDIESYSGLSFKYVISDEAQYLKNPATRNASAIKELKAEARFALTGTPIENALSELWSIFDFVMPGYLYNAGKFSRVFETPIIKQGDQDKAQELRRQIAPFILRRMKKDVLTELPDKAETNLYAEMSEEQRLLYAAYLSEARGELESAGQMEILALLTRLRQICCHPALFAEGYAGGSGKLELAVDTIVSAIDSGHRVLLFSQFTSMLEILNARLDKANITYFYLDGKTPASERLRMVERFNAGEREAFAISLKAGGAGLNLTGADVVVHYDPWWNPAIMDQATDRAHRYGQDKTVQVINIITRDSIEERIMELQARKKDLIDSVMTGGSFLSRMTAEEIRELFKD